MLCFQPSRTAIEAIPVIDDYCMELVAVEAAGPCARFVLASEQSASYETGEKIWVVQRKIILPIEAIRPGIDLTLRFLASRAARIAGQRILDLVK